MIERPYFPRELQRNIENAYVATQIFERLRNESSPHMGFDLDGVLFQGDAINGDRWADPHFPLLLSQLVDYSRFSAITARGPHGLELLRNIGDPRLLQTASLGQGHALLIDGEYQTLVPPENQLLFDLLWNDVLPHSELYLSSWEEVRQTEGPTFCRGDERYQNFITGTIWYRYLYKDEVLSRLLTIKTSLEERSRANIYYKEGEQPHKDLAWLRLGAEGLDKSHGIENIGVPHVYICDGPGDGSLVEKLHSSHQGLVVFISSSPDKETEEMLHVKQQADIILPTPKDLARVLDITNTLFQDNYGSTYPSLLHHL